MVTIRGIPVWKIVDVVVAEYRYNLDFWYEVWDEASLYIRNNFQEFMEAVVDELVYRLDYDSGSRVRSSVRVETGEFSTRHTYSISDSVPAISYPSHDMIEITVRKNRSFAFRRPMPAEEVFYDPAMSKSFLDSIKSFIREHYTRHFSSEVRIEGHRWEDGWFIYDDIISVAPTPQKNERAEALLLSQCDDEQVAQYKKHNYIIVCGHETGNTYRIRYAYQINIDVLDGSRVLYKLCTVADPELNAGMPIEDNMLAQKTLIELNEQEFLDIAIRW